MISIEFHGWVLECDREATLHAYSEVKYGGAESCTCSMCRNYITYREQVFPDEIIRLFTQLGIDLTKDVEVFHMAKESPYGHYYGGWFHFIGAIMKMSDPTVISQDFEIDI